MTEDARVQMSLFEVHRLRAFYDDDGLAILSFFFNHSGKSATVAGYSENWKMPSAKRWLPQMKLTVETGYNSMWLIAGVCVSKSRKTNCSKSVYGASKVKPGLFIFNRDCTNASVVLESVTISHNCCSETSNNAECRKPEWTKRKSRNG